MLHWLAGLPGRSEQDTVNGSERRHGHKDRNDPSETAKQSLGKRLQRIHSGLRFGTLETGAVQTAK